MFVPWVCPVLHLKGPEEQSVIEKANIKNLEFWRVYLSSATWGLLYIWPSLAQGTLEGTELR